MAAIATPDGELLNVFVNGVLIANSTDFKFSFKRDTRETTTKDGGNWKQLEYTKGSGTVSGSYLHAESGYNTAQLFEVMANRTKVVLKYGGTTSGASQYTATAVLTSVDISAPQKDNTTGSYSFDLDGAPVRALIP
jgi:hypothetical protein